jgi:D-tyrosyl-tRNA(Tyr) deacylase
MIAVVQRVLNTWVEVEGRQIAFIERGLLVLVGIANEDTEEDGVWLSKKIIHMRIFSDAEGKMNLSVKETGGDMIVVSQFTLHASMIKGNRPSFIGAAKADVAIPLYEKFIKQCEEELGKTIQTGLFGADMKVTLTNDGPVTILIDTKNKK